MKARGYLNIEDVRRVAIDVGEDDIPEVSAALAADGRDSILGLSTERSVCSSANCAPTHSA